MEPRKQIYESNKLQKRLRRLVGQAIADFDMIGPGDRVMVCLSGGKDSYALLELLLSLRRQATVEFEIIAFHLDQKHPGYPDSCIARLSRRAWRPVPHRATEHVSASSSD